MKAEMGRPITKWSIAVLYTYCIIVQSVYYSVLKRVIPSSNSFFIVMAEVLLWLTCMALPFFYHQPSVRFLGLRGNVKYGLQSGAIALVLLIGYIASFNLSMPPWEKIKMFGLHSWQIWIGVRYLVKAVGEAVLYFGFFQHALEERIGQDWSILIMTVLFVCASIPEICYLNSPFGLFELTGQISMRIPLAFILASLSKKKDLLYGGILLNWLFTWIINF